MQRKFIVILLVCMLALAVFLAGCGGNNNAINNNIGNNNGSSSTASGSTNASGSPDGGSSDTQEPVKLSLLVDNGQLSVAIAEKLIEKFNEKYPHIEIELGLRPIGGEGDNFIKTRLATGDMNDIFVYNSGSLMQAINPERNMVDLSNEPFMDNLLDSYKSVVSRNGKVYGVPFRSSVSGGWFYNKKVYAEHGLSVPKTWSELMANLEKLKGTGVAPIIGSFKDTWTSQLIVLADFYNVLAEEPNFPENYSANKANFAGTPAALRSFQKLAETVGYYNEDLMATTFDSALGMLAEGKGAHYPMLSSAVAAILQNLPHLVDDIGFFAQPGDDPDRHGLTIWMPESFYIYKNSKNIEAAKQFLAFVATVEGASIMSEAYMPSGPFVIKGAKLPDNVLPIVKDMLPYFDAGLTAPALEFLSPVKGPILEQLTVEVGAGIRSPEEAAALYDQDVAKQARQLGLEGW